VAADQPFGGPQAGMELHLVDRLLDEVVGTGVEHLDEPAAIAARRHHHDVEVALLAGQRPRLPAEFEATGARQFDARQQHADVDVLPKVVDGRLGAVEARDVVTPLGDHAGEDLRHDPRPVDDGDLHAGGLSRLPAGVALADWFVPPRHPTSNNLWDGSSRATACPTSFTRITNISRFP
jgi:hypothetical protein